MTRYAAFLRGINVGGHRVTSDALCVGFGELGCRDVSTFRASGNVVFTTDDDESPSELTSSLEAGLAASLGYAVPVYLRSASELAAIAAHRPFAQSLIATSQGKLQIALLAEPAAAGPRREVLALAPKEDRLAFGERELHWLPSGRLSDSLLDLKAIGKLLGPMTIRTKGTIDQIAAKYFAE